MVTARQQQRGGQQGRRRWRARRGHSSARRTGSGPWSPSPVAGGGTRPTGRAARATTAPAASPAAASTDTSAGPACRARATATSARTPSNGELSVPTHAWRIGRARRSAGRSGWSWRRTGRRSAGPRRAARTRPPSVIGDHEQVRHRGGDGTVTARLAQRVDGVDRGTGAGQADRHVASNMDPSPAATGLRRAGVPAEPQPGQPDAMTWPAPSRRPAAGHAVPAVRAGAGGGRPGPGRRRQRPRGAGRVPGARVGVAA